MYGLQPLGRSSQKLAQTLACAETCGGFPLRITMTMALFKLRTTHIPNVFPTLQVQQEQSKAERDLCCKSPKAAAWLAVRITRLVPLDPVGTSDVSP